MRRLMALWLTGTAFVAGCAASGSDASQTTASSVPAFDPHAVCTAQLFTLIRDTYDNSVGDRALVNGPDDPFLRQASLKSGPYAAAVITRGRELADTELLKASAGWCTSAGDPIRPGVDQDGELGTVTGNPTVLPPSGIDGKEEATGAPSSTGPATITSSASVPVSTPSCSANEEVQPADGSNRCFGSVVQIPGGLTLVVVGLSPWAVMAGQSDAAPTGTVIGTAQVGIANASGRAQTLDAFRVEAHLNGRACASATDGSPDEYGQYVVDPASVEGRRLTSSGGDSAFNVLLGFACPDVAAGGQLILTVTAGEPATAVRFVGAQPPFSD